MSDIGKLTLTRTRGQSILIDQNILLTVKQINHGRNTIGITVEFASERQLREYILDTSDSLMLGEDIHIKVARRSPNSSQVRVIIIAPKNIQIMRTELLNAPEPTATIH